MLSRLVLLVVVTTAVQASDCLFQLPASSGSGCFAYDLSSMYTADGFAASDITNPYQYRVGVCDALAHVLKGCEHLPAAPAYQIDPSTALCYALGAPGYNNTQVFPLRPGVGDAGIRVVYSGGTGGRVIVIDIPCDADAQLGGGPWPQVYEATAYHYFLQWPHPAGCPVSYQPNATCSAPTYDSSWASLLYRPLPQWFDQAKFGIFIHWGLFSVPAFKNEWYRFELESSHNPDYIRVHNRVYGCSGVEPDKFPCDGPSFKYADFAPMFKAELFDPDAWAALFKNAGAQYVVLTSKHHEGWCNFPSAQHWNWNSVDVGPRRDLVGDLTQSVRTAGLHMGLYHSLREWYQPLYVKDNNNNCTSSPSFPEQVLIPTLKDMTERYQPDIVWSDGAGDAPCTTDSVSYWKAPEFVSWLYNESPVKNSVLVNNRWGDRSGGDYDTGPDRYVPGHLVPHKWESCYTIQQDSWGYDRTEDISKYYSARELIQVLVSTVSCNGNLLLNVGPMADGTIAPAFQDRLLQMGAWLQINGEAIYRTQPWIFQNDTADQTVWYTSSRPSPGAVKGTVYAIALAWPTDSKLVLTQLQHVSAPSAVTLLGYGAVKFAVEADGLHIELPPLTLSQLPSTLAWTFKLQGMQLLPLPSALTKQRR